MNQYVVVKPKEYVLYHTGSQDIRQKVMNKPFSALFGYSEKLHSQGKCPQPLLS